jgi:iron complex transport system substrate-binding protein
MDAKADLVFRQRSARLDELRNMASKIDDAARPVVAYGNIYNGTIYTPSSDSTVAQEVAAAGGKYYLDNLPGEGSVQLSMEEFLSKAKDADIMIYTSMILYTPDRQALVEADPLFAELNAYKDDRVYVLAKSYYMQAAQTDVKFQEMVALIQPELGLEANGVFFEKLK